MEALKKERDKISKAKYLKNEVQLKSSHHLRIYQ